MTMIEVNVKAKKIEWGDILSTPEAVLQAVEVGRYIGIFKKDEFGSISLVDHLPPHNLVTPANVASWLSKGYIFRPHLLKRVICVQIVLMPGLLGPRLVLLTADNRSKMDARILEYGDAILDSFKGTHGIGYRLVPIEAKL